MAYSQNRWVQMADQMDLRQGKQPVWCQRGSGRPPCYRMG
jgi:hypothetical protein